MTGPHTNPDSATAGENSPAAPPKTPERPRVGYKSPPEHSRYRKGQPSANPNGRPKREETWQDLFNAELDKTIVVQENGKPKRITKRRAWMKRVANGTVTRKPHAVRTFLMFDKAGDAGEPRGLDFYIIG
jgi:hypothetical protein